jgi:hypothetical protein
MNRVDNYQILSAPFTVRDGPHRLLTTSVMPYGAFDAGIPTSTSAPISIDPKPSTFPRKPQFIAPIIPIMPMSPLENAPKVPGL